MPNSQDMDATRSLFQVDIDFDSIIPVYVQISNALRSSILDGRLRDGDNLPSIRELSHLLKVSRSTIAKAVEALASQGYVKSHAGSGVEVCRRYLGKLDSCSTKDSSTSIPLFAGQADSASPHVYVQGDHVQLSAYGRRLLKLSADSIYSDTPELQTYTSGPALDLTPLRHWKLLLEQNCRMKDLSRLEYSHEPFGYPPLREAYAAYLTRARAVKCSSEQVIVFSARELRLDLICRMLIDPGDCVAVENPGYPDVRQRFESYGAHVVSVATDRDGLCVEQLVQLEEKIKIVYVSPSYVDPTGVVLSMARRQKLLLWAAQKGAFIVEDDYASEYRYRSRPLPSLQGMDSAGRVIHLSCLWKVLFPVLRLGFLVIPNSLAEIFTLSKGLNENDLPLFDQFALTDFINDGSLERHIRRTRTVYARRRDVLVDALQTSLGDRIKILNEAAGFELLVNFQTKLKDHEVLTLSRLHKLPLFSSQPHYTGKQRDGEFVIPFASLGEDSVADYVSKLCALLT